MRAAVARAFLLGAVLLAAAGAAQAQDIEPRAYSNVPVGVNFLALGYAYTRGGLSFDPAVPVTDAELQTSSALLAYARSFGILGMSAKFDAIVPFSWLSGTAVFAGQPVEREVDGFGDPAFRVSVNLYGAPALDLHDFMGYRQDLIIGASLRVTAPLGQYDPERAVNLGTNRWSVRPEIGASKAFGPLTLDAHSGATFYTDNSDFLGGRTRAQDPIFYVQGHAIYSFSSGYWLSADVTHYTGGRTTVNGDTGDDLQRNWRVGATLSVPIDARYSLRFYASRGVSARTGNNYDLLGVALQYRWGGGL